MQKNDALEVFSQHFHVIVKLTEILQSIPESIKNLSGDKITDLPNDFLSLDMKVKVTVASNFLTLLLGRPPTIEELKVVTGESYFKIQRFLKGTDVCLPYVLRKVNSSEITGLRRTPKLPPKNPKTLVWKGPGIRDTGRLDTMDRGRPNVFPIFMASPLVNMLELGKKERDRLLTYLASPPYVDAMKRLTVEWLKFLLKVMDTDFMRACKKILSDSLSVVWERAAKIAKEKSLLQKEFEKLPLNDWTLFPYAEEFKHMLHKLIKEIEEMPNETFATNCIIPAFTKGLGFEGLVSKPFDKYKAELRCTRCLCVSPISASSEIVTCVFCGTKYKK